MTTDARTRRFEVRFASLFRPGRALAFPCDREGRVDPDALSEQARRNYALARAQIGREYATPLVREAVPPLGGHAHR